MEAINKQSIDQAVRAQFTAYPADYPIHDARGVKSATPDAIESLVRWCKNEFDEVDYLERGELFEWFEVTALAMRDHFGLSHPVRISESYLEPDGPMDDPIRDLEGKVTRYLDDVYHSTGTRRPDNHQAIVDWITDDIMETVEPEQFSVSCVWKSFGKWVNLQTGRGR